MAALKELIETKTNPKKRSWRQFMIGDDGVLHKETQRKARKYLLDESVIKEFAKDQETHNDLEQVLSYVFEKMIKPWEKEKCGYEMIRVEKYQCDRIVFSGLETSPLISEMEILRDSFPKKIKNVKVIFPKLGKQATLLLIDLIGDKSISKDYELHKFRPDFFLDKMHEMMSEKDAHDYPKKFKDHLHPLKCTSYYIVNQKKVMEKLDCDFVIDTESKEYIQYFDGIASISLSFVDFLKKKFAVDRKSRDVELTSISACNICKQPPKYRLSVITKYKTLDL